MFKILDPLDGITAEALRRLTSRKSPQGRTPVEQWYDTWKVLFPNDSVEDVKPPGESRPLWMLNYIRTSVPRYVGFVAVLT